MIREQFRLHNARDIVYSLRKLPTDPVDMNFPNEQSEIKDVIGFLSD
jgi:hypothetical protein